MAIPERINRGADIPVFVLLTPELPAHLIDQFFRKKVSVVFESADRLVRSGDAGAITICVIVVLCGAPDLVGLRKQFSVQTIDIMLGSSQSIDDGDGLIKRVEAIHRPVAE